MAWVTAENFAGLVKRGKVLAVAQMDTEEMRTANEALAEIRDEARWWRIERIDLRVGIVAVRRDGRRRLPF